jgi:hypothetical protein
MNIKYRMLFVESSENLLGHAVEARLADGGFIRSDVSAGDADSANHV